MNRKGFIDEINPMWVALALLGAIIPVFMFRYNKLDLGFWNVAIPIVVFIGVFAYLHIRYEVLDS